MVHLTHIDFEWRNKLAQELRIDDAVRVLIHEDLEGLAVISERVNEPEISYDVLLNDLKSHGKI